MNDWNLDIDDDGAQVATCPHCGSHEVISASPERLECCECDHTSEAHS